MLGTVFRFELRYHAARPVTWLYAALYFGASVMLASFSLGGDPGSLVKTNAPATVAAMMFVVVLMGQVVLTALVGTATLRDQQVGAHELLFATPIGRTAYLGGRFLGVLAVMLVIHLAIPLGLAAGAVAPWGDAERSLPFSMATYARGYLVLVAPTVVSLTATFFAVGALTRNLFVIYVQGIILITLWSISQKAVLGLEGDRAAALADPFGIQALDNLTRFWTAAEQNTRQVPFTGDMLASRLLWLGVAASLFGITFTLFRFRKEPPSPKLLRRRRAEPEVPPPVAALAWAATPTFSAVARWRQYLSIARLTARDIVRSVPFLAIAAMGTVSAFTRAWNAPNLADQAVWLTTYRILEALSMDGFLILILLVTIFAGEVVWRERDLGAGQVTDAAPLPDGLSLFGKFTGLAVAIATVMLVYLLAGPVLQAIKGTAPFDWGLAFRWLFGLLLPSVLQYAALAVMAHALVNRKALGHVLVIGVYLVLMVRGSLGIEHRLFDFAGHPEFKYSEMNGFGPFGPSLVLATLYWSGVAILMLVVTRLAWVRGTDVRRSARLALARRRLRGTILIPAAFGLAVTAGAGGVIYYNTNVLNRYQTTAELRHQRAEYERTYRFLLDLPQPSQVHQDTRVDLEPERDAVQVKGRFTYVNRAAHPIDTVVVAARTMGLAGRRQDVVKWDRPVEWVLTDTVTGIRIGRFQPPLVPGDTAVLTTATTWQERGFANAGPQTDLVANGTFMDPLEPRVGYQERWEVRDDPDRRKEGLPLRPRAPALDDPSARNRSDFASSRWDAGWVTAHTVVSTAPGQTALAVGALVRDTVEGGRPVFEYRTEGPVVPFWPIMSARYAVKRDRWRNVALEIWYHPGHEVNLDDMMAGMKATLDYHATNVSPYPYSQLRVMERPRYDPGANAVAGGIPWSEDAGFLLRKPESDEALDFPFWAAAHETAHQWWGHVLVPADAQGAGVLVEGLAEYTALTVMENRDGPAAAGKFLRDELSIYLNRRSADRRGELPLIKAEGYGKPTGQGYLYYRKAAIAFYALRDLIGEAALNAALRKLITDFGQQGPPYPTTRDLVANLRAVTPDSLQPVLTDLFETITLWENRADSATAVKQPDGTWRVRLVLGSAKFRADSIGNQTAMPLSEYVDVGVFGPPAHQYPLGKPLYLAKQHIADSTTVVDVVVKGEPKRAGIDPYFKLIDRTPADNVIPVTIPR